MDEEDEWAWLRGGEQPRTWRERNHPRIMGAEGRLRLLMKASEIRMLKSFSVSEN